MGLLTPFRSKNRVLVIAAHPDDEVLGCGGTIILHKARGDEVCVVIAAGRSELESGYGLSQTSFASAAAAVLGVDEVKLLGLPDQKLDTVPLLQITRNLEQAVLDWRPNVVYIHHCGDVNRDHQILYKAALVATRPTHPYIQGVYAYETISSTEWGYPRNFQPDLWVDISSVLNQKMKAMECYGPELRAYPHPRSLEAIRNRAVAWGNQCCLDAAEVFVTIRTIVRNNEENL